jgi:hypothetical protein
MLAAAAAAPPRKPPGLALEVRGPYGDARWRGKAPFSEGNLAQDSAVRVTGVAIRRGLWTDSIQLRYGRTWGPARGGSGGAGSNLTFDGVVEFVAEAWVSADTFMDTLVVSAVSLPWSSGPPCAALS